MGPPGGPMGPPPGAPMGPGGYQPGMQASSGGSNKTPLIILAIVGVAAVAAGAFFLLSGDDSKSDTSSPAATVESYINAMQDGDCEAGNELVVESMQMDCDAEAPEGAGAPAAALESTEVEVGAIEVAEETETEATVSYELTVNGSDQSDTAHLVNQDGAWLIDQLFGGTMTGGGTDPGATTIPGGGSTDTTLPTDTTPPPIGTDTTLPSSGGSTTAGSPTPPPFIDTSESRVPDQADVDACYAGDMVACDDMWIDTPGGSDIEEWSETCGGRLPPSEAQSTECESRLGPTVSP